MARCIALLLAGLAAACSSHEEAVSPDGSAASCLAPVSVGALGELAGAEAVRSNQSGSMGTRKVWRVGAFVDAEAPHDQILVELWDDLGPFAGGAVTTGTFEIAGDDTLVATCGVCVYLYGDVIDATPSQSYLAQSGTVMIDQLLPELIGSVDGLAFREIDGDDQVVEDGCASSIDSASFSATVACYDGGGDCSN